MEKVSFVLKIVIGICKNVAVGPYHHRCSILVTSVRHSVCDESTGLPRPPLSMNPLEALCFGVCFCPRSSKIARSPDRQANRPTPMVYAEGRVGGQTESVVFLGANTRT